MNEKAAYATIRIGKVAKGRSMTAAYKHDFRLVNVPNADSTLSFQNRYLINTPVYFGKPMPLNKYWDVKSNALPKKPRSDAKALEIVLAVPAKERDRIDIDRWIKVNMDWVCQNFDVAPKKYGSNILTAVYHGDEEAPHMHILIMPVDEEGHVNAKRWVSRYPNPEHENFVTFQQLHDSYGELMEHEFGLKRGRKHSFKEHKKQKEYYAELNELTAIPVPLPDEPASDYYERYEEDMKAKARKILEEKEKETDRMNNRFVSKYNRLEKRNEELNTELEEYKARCAALQAEIESYRNRNYQNIKV